MKHTSPPSKSQELLVLELALRMLGASDRQSGMSSSSNCMMSEKVRIEICGVWCAWLWSVNVGTGHKSQVVGT